MNRHSGLSVQKPENLSLCRAMNMNEQVLKNHFDGHLEVLNLNNILGKPDRLWNIDEKGLIYVFEFGNIVSSTKMQLFFKFYEFQKIYYVF